MTKKLIITIGRQFGSGGKCVAEELGKKLGIPVYDNELLMKAAQESGIAPEFFAQNDEKKNLFTALADKFYDAQNYLSGSRLFQMQCEAIKDIAEKGSAVIVGRCADYVLRDMENVLDVFLTSSVDTRAKRVAARMKISEADAVELIEQKDTKRAEYYNYYTFGHWGKAATYDICLDSGKLGIEGTADFIIDFATKSGML